MNNQTKKVNNMGIEANVTFKVNFPDRESFVDKEEDLFWAVCKLCRELGLETAVDWQVKVIKDDTN